jgi:flavin-binding protein dodecin
VVVSRNHFDIRGGTPWNVSAFEIVGTSPDGIEAAVRSDIHRAGQPLRHLGWFEVAHFQVGMKVGFRLEDTA